VFALVVLELRGVFLTLCRKSCGSITFVSRSGASLCSGPFRLL